MSLSALSASLKAIFNFSSTLTGANRSQFQQQDDIESAQANPALQLALGAAAGLANQVTVYKRTLSASASEQLNFSGGTAPGAIALKNPNGEAATISKLLGLLIINTSTTGILSIGGDATYDIASLVGARNQVIKVRPGAFIMIGCAQTDATGYAVATNEALKLVNNDGANPLTYEIWAIGQI